MEETIKKIRRVNELYAAMSNGKLTTYESVELKELEADLDPIDQIEVLLDRITELENQVNYYENGDETYNLKAAARKLADYIEQNDL